MGEVLHRPHLDRVSWPGDPPGLEGTGTPDQLESSSIRDADALSRLCFVLAITTLYLVSQGTVIVEQGIRRLVDPHWFRGNNYLQIGRKWVNHALSKGLGLATRLHLSSVPDPEPALAS